MDQKVFAQAVGLKGAAARWYTPVMQAMTAFDITTRLRQGMFLAQIAHESMVFSRLAESFDYSVEGLKIFSALSAADRQCLGRKPNEPYMPRDRQAQIANIVYANRGGNNDAHSGDGWLYRGSGLMQLTFKNNFAAFKEDAAITDPDYANRIRTDDQLAASSAAWYWQKMGCNEAADKDDFDATTRIITGPAMTGKMQRAFRWSIAKHALSL